MKRSWVHVPLKPEFLMLLCDFHKTAMISVFNGSAILCIILSSFSKKYFVENSSFDAIALYLSAGIKMKFILNITLQRR